MQGVGITHQHAGFCGPANARDNRHWRRQPQCARTGDDQHRGSDHQGVDNLRRRAKEVPDSGAEQGNTHHHRHENSGNFIRQLADLRLAALGLAHHADDARQRSVAADGTGAEQHAAILHHRTGVDALPGAFLLRHRLAGEHGFVKPGFALGYVAVHRHAIAGRQAQDHPCLNLGQRQVLFTVFRDYPGGLRG